MGACHPHQSPVKVTGEDRDSLAEGQGRELHATLDGQAVQLAAAAEPAWDAGQVGAKAFRRKPGSVIEVPTAGCWHLPSNSLLDLMWVYMKWKFETPTNNPSVQLGDVQSSKTVLQNYSSM